MVFLANLTPVGAASANISHSYKSDAKIGNGSLVSLDPARTDYVLPASTDNATQLLGIVLDAKDSLLAVDETAGKLQVATSGTVTALVSTVNGDIAVGDQISVSPFRGIGQKAASGMRVVGLAQTGFKANASGSTQQTVTDLSGKQHTLSVGYTRLTIGIGTGSVSSNDQLNGLQSLAKSITGRKIATARIVLSLVVAIIAFVAIVTLMYTSIYSGIISIGRNPLAKYAVFRTLFVVLSMALGLGLIAAIIIVFLLR